MQDESDRPGHDADPGRAPRPLQLGGVVLIAQAAHHLAGHLTWHGLGQFTVVFTLVWIAWANGSLHHELHGRDDARARSTFLMQILVLAATGAFIQQADGARGAAFAAAAGVLFAILAVTPGATGARPRARCPPEHPLGSCGRAPLGQATWWSVGVAVMRSAAITTRFRFVGATNV
jgi:hypothetical protein